MVKGFIINTWSKGFGFGLAPVASGTFGTLVAIPCYFLFSKLALVYHLLVWFLFLLFSFFSADFTASQLKAKDPGCIVCDEVIGFWLVLLLTYTDYISLITAFLLLDY